MNDRKKDRWLDQLPFLNQIYQEEIEFTQPFEEAAASFARDRGTILLQSGSKLDCSRYHILAIDPWLEIRSCRDRINICHKDLQFDFRQDVFFLIQDLLDRYRIPAGTSHLPVLNGLFGYFAYDLKDRIETLPCTCVDTTLPDLYLMAPSAILIHDITAGKTHLCIPVFTSGRNGQPAFDDAMAIKDVLIQRLDIQIKPQRFCVQSTDFKSSFTKAEYIEAVNKIIRYLKAGDIYQANLSQRFEIDFSGDTFALFLDLFKRNPASFFAYVNAGDHQIVSTSPERFIKQAGRFVETRPIKGTIARGKNREQDIANSQKLTSSIKDDAELTMIVDLMRNDLSRVTEDGSVTVTQHKRLEPYENVYHLVSIVQGRLSKGHSSVDLIKATFPGGSITGCPKIRAMEIIDELEPVKRHVYTGSIGYISFHDTMDLSIAIRTATIFKQKVFFSVGGGIVCDSDPHKEYQETLDKGKTLIESLSGTTQALPVKKEKVWLNGRLIDKEMAAVPLTSFGFQYGAGLFETIKVDGGRIYFLEKHIKRMERAWQALFGSKPPDMDWNSVIKQVIGENAFEADQIAVKIMAAKDDTCVNGVMMAVTAQPYTHRLQKVKKTGLDIVSFKHPRLSYLADYKTLNYFFYDQAGKSAKKKGADEALILNPDGSVSETNTANIIAVKERKVIVPQSEHMLSGITLSKTVEILAKQSYDILKGKITYREMLTYPNIMVTNSLMGAVKVLSIDGEKIVHDQSVCSMINKQIFGKTIITRGSL